jgi:hypothetical protein
LFSHTLNQLISVSSFLMVAPNFISHKATGRPTIKFCCNFKIIK